MEETRARELGLRPRARIICSAVSAVDPSRMGVGPIVAIERALATAKIAIDEVDIFRAQ